MALPRDRQVKANALKWPNTTIFDVFQLRITFIPRALATDPIERDASPRYILLPLLLTCETLKKQPIPAISQQTRAILLLGLNLMRAPCAHHARTNLEDSWPCAEGGVPVLEAIFWHWNAALGPVPNIIDPCAPRAHPCARPCAHPCAPQLASWNYSDLQARM